MMRMQLSLQRCCLLPLLVLFFFIVVAIAEERVEVPSEEGPLAEEVGVPGGGSREGSSSGDRPSVIRYGTQNYRRVMNQLRKGKKIRDINFNPKAEAEKEATIQEAMKRRDEKNEKRRGSGPRMTSPQRSSSADDAQQPPANRRRQYATSSHPNGDEDP